MARRIVLTVLVSLLASSASRTQTPDSALRFLTRHSPSGRTAIRWERPAPSFARDAASNTAPSTRFDLRIDGVIVASIPVPGVFDDAAVADDGRFVAAGGSDGPLQYGSGGPRPLASRFRIVFVSSQVGVLPRVVVDEARTGSKGPSSRIRYPDLHEVRFESESDRFVVDAEMLVDPKQRDSRRYGCVEVAIDARFGKSSSRSLRKEPPHGRRSDTPKDEPIASFETLAPTPTGVVDLPTRLSIDAESGARIIQVELREDGSGFARVAHGGDLGGQDELVAFDPRGVELRRFAVTQPKMRFGIVPRTTFSLVRRSPTLRARLDTGEVFDADAGVLAADSRWLVHEPWPERIADGPDDGAVLVLSSRVAVCDADRFLRFDCTPSLPRGTTLEADAAIAEDGTVYVASPCDSATLRVERFSAQGVSLGSRRFFIVAGGFRITIARSWVAVGDAARIYFLTRELEPIGTIVMSGTIPLDPPAFDDRATPANVAFSLAGGRLAIATPTGRIATHDASRLLERPRVR